MEKRQDDQYLKDLIFRGAFLVVLVYVLVFVYNSGLLSRLRKLPTPASLPLPSPVTEIQQDNDQSDYVQPESSESQETVEEPREE